MSEYTKFKISNALETKGIFSEDTLLQSPYKYFATDGTIQDCGFIPVSYLELITLYDNKSLVPGLQYRITDYECTTTQENTQSAKHQFDIIVTADTESILNENARATIHNSFNIADVNLDNYTINKNIIKLQNNQDVTFDLEYYDVFEYNGTKYNRWIAVYNERKTSTYFVEGDYFVSDWGTYADGELGDNIIFALTPITTPITELIETSPIYWLKTVGRYNNINNFVSVKDDKILNREDTTLTYKNLVIKEIIRKDMPLRLFERYNCTNNAPFSDFGRFFQLTGTFVLEGETYYRWQLYNNGKLAKECQSYLTSSIDLNWGGDIIGYEIEGCYRIFEDKTKTNINLYHTKDIILESNYMGNTRNTHYFDNCKLLAWELKYCITNDKDRFYWADTVNGKGVIYYMKDEWNNECWYDFKNIQFKRYEIINYTKVPSLTINNEDNPQDFYYGTMQLDGETQVLEDATYGNSMWCYTFNYKDLNDNSWFDGSLVGNKYPTFLDVCCKDNSIEAGNNDYESYGWLSKLYLNNIVFYGCAGQNAGASACYDNKIKASCFNMTFGKHSYGNNINIYNYYNIFGNSCDNNIFGNICNSNIFGNSCDNNIFGNSCDNNIFGNSCNNNIFGNICNNNALGIECYFNTFGNGCYFIIFGNSSSTKNYYRNNIIDNGINNIRLNANTSDSNYCQNVHIGLGVNNTDTYKDITIADTDLNALHQISILPANSKTILI